MKIVHHRTSAWYGVLIAAVVMFALLANTIGLVVTGAHVAHASATPTTVQASTVSYNDARNNNSLTTSLAFNSNVASGDEVVVLFSYAGGTNCGSPTYSDSRSSSWTFQTSVQDGLNDTAIIATATLGSSGAETVSVSLPSITDCGVSGGNFVSIALTIVEVSGQGSEVSGSANAADNGGGGTSHSTGATLSTANDALDLGSYVDAGSNKALSLPSGESQVGSKQDSTVNFQFDQASAAAQSSMTFTTSGSAGYAAMAAISIPSA